MFAVENKNETIVKLTLDYGVDINLGVVICEKGIPSILVLLLKRGCDINNVSGPNDKNPLHYALHRHNELRKKNYEIVKTLKISEQKYDKYALCRQNHNNLLCVYLLNRCGCSWTQRDKDRISPLRMEKKSLDIMHIYTHSSLPDENLNASNVPLLTSIVYDNIEEMKHVITSYSLDTACSYANYYSETAVSIGARYGHLQNVKKLVKMGFDTNQADFLGVTALHRVVESGSI